MKTERKFPRFTVSKKAEASLRAGHPWIYDTEITDISGDTPNGCLADAVSAKGTYLGTGLYSEKSKIRLRILAANANEAFGEAFFERRLRYAVEYRKTVMGEDFSCCRLIFGEADGLPGLTVDRFSNILVAQVLSYGIDIRKNMIFSLLWKIMRELGEKIDGIYERNDAAIRALEGLPEYKGWTELCGGTHPQSTQTEITENGIRYAVDFENGQKTGFFLDQKYNRREIARLSRGKTFLDCFTHTGSFALNAAMGGAKVTAVDISETALDMARNNAAKNGLSDKIEFIRADVFDYLRLLHEKREKPYDFILLDPPAFTKSRKTVGNAANGYREINSLAMRILPRGGYLATCSCSHFMRDDLFRKMLAECATEVGVKLRQIEARTQAPDHPILWGVPETEYLKFYIFQIE
mgnify:FL=1|jgi:ribosomal protein L11 methyltransferase (prmA)